ncbi:hypothetical protein BCEN4_670006 [Burkholderia cenocepacia]|nr:hypothetical protein BCEN4_670006 [Burkholderia cenocepacia]
MGLNTCRHPRDTKPALSGNFSAVPALKFRATPRLEKDLPPVRPHARRRIQHTEWQGSHYRASVHHNIPWLLARRSYR